MDDIRDFILEFLQERGADVSAESLGEARLSDGTLLDSFGVLTLLMAIEDAYDVKITPVDMLEDDNKSVDGLIRLIAKRMKQ